jgi:hypothetical protein
MPEIGVLRHALEVRGRTRRDETQPRAFAAPAERLGGDKRDVVASRPQRATDSDERVYVAARAYRREKKMGRR